MCPIAIVTYLGGKNPHVQGYSSQHPLQQKIRGFPSFHQQRTSYVNYNYTVNRNSQNYTAVLCTHVKNSPGLHTYTQSWTKQGLRWKYINNIALYVKKKKVLKDRHDKTGLLLINA